MDVSTIVGQELVAVEFVQDFLQLRFDGPLLTLFEWPHVMATEASMAFGEPGYRDALCAQIGEEVTAAALEEGDALTIEFANGMVIGLSLRMEDLAVPEAGFYSESGAAADQVEF